MDMEFKTSSNCEPITPQTGRTVRICRPEGIYSVIYGMHTELNDPNSIPIDTNGIFLETGPGYNYTGEENPMITFNHFRGNPIPGRIKHNQYLPIFDQLARSNIPIYFADLHFTDNSILLKEIGIPVGEFLGAFGLSVNLLHRIATKKLSRWDFLKVAAVTWLVAPRVSMESRLFASMIHTGYEPTGEMLKVTHRIHPEFLPLTITLRNAVTAHKQRWLMREVGNQPHFTTSFGAAHVEFEDEIKKSREDRMRFIRLTKPFWQDLVTPETLYTITKFEYDGSDWKVAENYHVPELKHLVS